MSLLEVVHLKKIYDGKMPCTALEGVSFTVEKGEFTAIMGPSGSGKSTLLNVIFTVDMPTSGKVLVNGQEPHTMKEQQLAEFRRRELGFIFQDYNLIHTLTVRENIMFPLVLENKNPQEIKKRAEDIARYLNIQSILDKRTFEISGGQAQRTAVARALAANPSILLADEPTGNLDSKSAKEVMGLFQKLNVEWSSTILMVTHDAYVASMCKRVLFIKDGRLYQQMERGGSQPQFYQKILDMMTFLGGDQRDAVSNSL